LSTDVGTARSLVKQELGERKIVATHYQHVDGTSFAAPIMASVVAQMLEANQNLTPTSVKNIVTSTASRLTNFSAIRQGFGILNAKLAVEEALNENHFLDYGTLTPRPIEGGGIVFLYHDDNAKTIHLVGDFNNWIQSENQFFKNENGLWQTEISIPPAGKYRYKFIIDSKFWKEDASNGIKEEDGYGGFNSILIIE
jgi:serine protease AprX